MTPMIEAQDLTKAFGKTTALDGLNLVAEAGQVVAVLGPNGAGKTTFVRAVATLLALDGGTLRVAGYDVRREPAAVRRTIGLAGQFAAVEPAMTGRENLEMIANLFGASRRVAQASAGASSSVSPRRVTVSRGRTPAGCGDGLTWGPVSSARRGCCCSTSPRPGLTRAAGSSSGTRSGDSCRPAPTCC
jgi:ABC-type polar amino acid transport system ATPase subunit